MSENDGEIIAAWEPGPARFVLVLAFDELEDMARARELTLSAMCGWTDEGERFDRAEVVAMTRAAVGTRPMLGGSVTTRLLVSSAEQDRDLEEARRALAVQDLKRRAPVGATVVDKWKPDVQQVDLLERWAEDAITAYPAGERWRPRAKPARIRKGFNSYAEDHGAPEAQLHGIHGGRALVDFLRARFPDELEYVADPSNPYVQGLHRKEGAKRSWFPTIQGVDT